MKQKLHFGAGKTYAYPREVWWCAVGVNIGVEIDGKHDNFERPVLVLRVYNKETLLILPLTGKTKDDQFHCRVRSGSRDFWVKLTQTRVISNKRLIRKIDVIPTEEFEKVKVAIQKYL